jgi:hypothetical protein
VSGQILNAKAVRALEPTNRSGYELNRY